MHSARQARCLVGIWAAAVLVAVQVCACRPGGEETVEQTVEPEFLDSFVVSGLGRGIGADGSILDIAETDTGEPSMSVVYSCCSGVQSLREWQSLGLGIGW